MFTKWKIWIHRSPFSPIRASELTVTSWLGTACGCWYRRRDCSVMYSLGVFARNCCWDKQDTLVLWCKFPLWNHECLNWSSRWQWWGEDTGGGGVEEWMKLCVSMSLHASQCQPVEGLSWFSLECPVLSFSALCQVNSNTLLRCSVTPIM